MDRRAFIVGGMAAFATPFAADAEQPKPPRIGFLLIGFGERAGGAGPAQAGLTSPFAAFRDGLRELGWIENENIAIEYRWAGEDPQRLPELAAELVRLKVDIIIGGTPGVRAAQHATTSIPIVMCIADDAVTQGFVPNLARPGGNITGMTSASELAGKRLDLFTAGHTKGLPRRPPLEPAGIRSRLYEGNTDGGPLVGRDASIRRGQNGE